MATDCELAVNQRLLCICQLLVSFFMYVYMYIEKCIKWIFVIPDIYTIFIGSKYQIRKVNSQYPCSLSGQTFDFRNITYFLPYTQKVLLILRPCKPFQDPFQINLLFVTIFNFLIRFYVPSSPLFSTIKQLYLEETKNIDI